MQIGEVRGLGFGLVRRATFVSAKVAKTIDAPSGFMEEEGRQPVKSGPTRGAQTRAARCEERPSWEPAGRRRNIGGEEFLWDSDSSETSAGRIVRGRKIPESVPAAECLRGASFPC